MAELIRLQTTIFSLIFCGFFFRRKGIISEEGQKNITDLVIYLILPWATTGERPFRCACRSS